MEVIEVSDLTVDSEATTIPVRVPGSPSLDRLNVKMMSSFQIGVACVKMIFGNGAP